MAQALISLRHVSRYYQTGDTKVTALDNISLDIHRGDFVAIMGQSGSGKSTLMNILGCLDTPDAGTYHIDGHDVASLSVNELSALRLKTFGFVFQRYQLLSNYTAVDNVAMPAIYSGTDYTVRQQRAEQLLARLELGSRADHKPSELSGGQQQRVSIARAMINGAQVILADEPTGALDSQSGERVLALLKQLNDEGVTVILITHDADIAEHAKRIIHFRDGKAISDTQAPSDSTAILEPQEPLQAFPGISTLECIRLAMRGLSANVFRTLLTLLGIVIGVASVVIMMAVGEGSKQQVLGRIQAIGTNIIYIKPGGGNIRSSGDIATLSLADADAIRAQVEGLAAVAPERSGRATMRFGDKDYSGRFRGTSPDYFRARDWQIAAGTFFDQADVDAYAPVVVIGQTVVDALFTQGEDPVGQYVLIKNAVYQVIGVLKVKGAGPSGDDMDDDVIMPITTAKLRIFGRDYLNGITIKVEKTEAANAAKKSITQLLIERHGREDIKVRTTESLVKTVTATQTTLTYLLGAVAAISLLVGGIGVMNIMLVNVSERRREIGLRIATGAKPRDILRQFNIEALVVCLLGGVMGVVLGFFSGFILQQFDIAISYSLTPALIAFITCVLVGMVFGYAPAHKAANLNPVVALTED